MKASDECLNKIVKSLRQLFPAIDERTAWVDFLPMDSGRKLFAVGFSDGRVKYADVSGMSPFDAANHLMGCMEDKMFSKQFLTDRKMADLQESVSVLAKKTAMNREIVSRLVRRKFSKKELFTFMEKCIDHGIFPDVIKFFTETEARCAVSEMIESLSFTTYDSKLAIELAGRICEEKKDLCNILQAEYTETLKDTDR